MRLILSCTLIALFIGCKQANSNQENTRAPDSTKVGKVEQWNEKLSDVLNPKARPQILAEGFEWTEGPVWVEDHQFLYFL